LTIAERSAIQERLASPARSTVANSSVIASDSALANRSTRAARSAPVRRGRDVHDRWSGHARIEIDRNEVAGDSSVAGDWGSVRASRSRASRGYRRDVTS
jgi:hypothetical protein